MLRRSSGTLPRPRRVRSRPPTMIRPCVGSISFSSRRISVDLPEPDAPTTNTNSPFSITKETASSAVTSGWQTFGTAGNTTTPPALAACRCAYGSNSATAVGMSVCRSVMRVPGTRWRDSAPAPAQRTRSLPNSKDVPGGLRQQILPDEPVEIAVEDALRVSDFKVGAEVFHKLIRVEDIAADLAPEAGRDDGSALFRHLLLPLLLEPLGEARTKDLHRRVLVRRLGALVLALDDDSRREVRDPHRRVGLVHVLAAGARGAVGVDPQVVVLEVEVDVVVEERRDDHLREARVPAVRLIERRETDEPVHAALGLQRSVRVLTAHGERRRLEPVLLPWARLDHVGLEAAPLGPAQVHAQ